MNLNIHYFITVEKFKKYGIGFEDWEQLGIIEKESDGNINEVFYSSEKNNNGKFVTKISKIDRIDNFAFT